MNARKHIALVVHGARAGRQDFRHMVRWVRNRGHTVDVRVTYGRGDGEALARDAATAGADVVAAVGGDGTLNEVVNGLDGFDTPLGIVPLGTGNLLARNLDVPINDVPAAFTQALEGGSRAGQARAG